MHRGWDRFLHKPLYDLCKCDGSYRVKIEGPNLWSPRQNYRADICLELFELTEKLYPARSQELLSSALNSSISYNAVGCFSNSEPIKYGIFTKKYFCVINCKVDYSFWVHFYLINSKKGLFLKGSSCSLWEQITPLKNSLKTSVMKIFSSKWSS